MTGPGGLTRYVLAAVAGIDYAAEDPRHQVMVELIRLAARYDAAPESRMTDVIRRMLSMVTASPGEECGPLAAIKCRVLLREAEGFLVPANS